jgi:hypothetical protein
MGEGNCLKSSTKVNRIKNKVHFIPFNLIIKFDLSSKGNKTNLYLIIYSWRTGPVGADNSLKLLITMDGGWRIRGVITNL